MEKKIEDYLQYYIGCDVWDEYDDDIKTLYSVAIDGQVQLKKNTLHGRDYREVKPILRPLSSMTEEEYDEYNNIYEDVYKGGRFLTLHHGGKGVFYLLSKHFDLWNLIESNLAIDSTTLKSKTL